MNDLERSFGDLVALNAEAVRLSTDQGDDWRRRLVSARRSLASSLAEVGRQLDAERGRAPPGHAEFAASFRAMRHALAIHQASWPASTLDTDSLDYKASVASLRTAFAALKEQASAFFAKGTPQP